MFSMPKPDRVVGSVGGHEASDHKTERDRLDNVGIPNDLVEERMLLNRI